MVLGANVARHCVEAGLLDEIIVHIAPVLVGDGTRFFERPGGQPIKLEPISSVVEGDTTVLRYRIVYPDGAPIVSVTGGSEARCRRQRRERVDAPAHG